MFQDRGDDLAAIVASMTAVEKVDVLSGRGLWKTSAIDRLGVPSIVMTDGTYGVRYSTQIGSSDEDGESLRQFLAVVNQRADGNDQGMFGATRPATCFPNGNLIGCSWDVDLAYAIGEVLAAECLNLGVRLLLGPGINTRRTPLAGRAYEYYSEDPVINGELAAGIICGLQDNGVGASLKHFACNNSEIDRTNTSSEVDERTLREIYLAGFERAIKKSSPWTVMSAYNPVNGIQAAENHWLLTRVLREEWGYEGAVISDWHAIKDRPAALRAGTDLDMPESKSRKEALLKAIEAGEIDQDILDEACLRVLDLVCRCLGAAAYSTIDLDSHHELARRMAAESIVLLKNDQAALPLSRQHSERLLVIGNGAVKPVIQGSGSATTNPFRIDVPLEQIRRLAGKNSVRHLSFPPADQTQINVAISEAVAAAQETDTVVVFASNCPGKDGEGSDRDNLRLVPGQDDLIQALAHAGHRTVVVLTMPDAVEMPWAEDVDSILACFYPGQGGGEAIARVLFGEQNPCGKLSVTFPKRIEDIPGFHSYPGEHARHCYSEGIFVGYRFYDLKAVEPLFPFGHGLSFTSFSYENLSLDVDQVTAEGNVMARVTIRNAGNIAGKEIVQLYVRPIQPGLRRPVRELKSFAKVELQPGEATTVAMTLHPRDFQYFDTQEGRWTLRAEAFAIEIAASSRDIRLSKTLPCVSDERRPPILSTALPPSVVFTHPCAEAALMDFISGRLKISANETQSIIDAVRHSFLGFYESLSWFIGDSIPEADIQSLFTKINNETFNQTRSLGQ